MVDFHTHILPNIDDGSTSVDMSIKILDLLEDSKVTDVVLTPHFYSDMESLKDFLLRRDNKYSEFLKIYNGNINLHIGAEVYISKYLSNYDDLGDLCIDGKKYMLLELPFDDVLSDEYYQIIETIIFNYNITPIIAHIERYPFIHYKKNTDIIDTLISIGCLIQVNSDSLLVNHKSKKFILFLIENNMAHFIGSDVHNLTSRPPNYGKAIKIIKDELGISYINNIEFYEKKVIGN